MSKTWAQFTLTTSRRDDIWIRIDEIVSVNSGSRPGTTWIRIRGDSEDILVLGDLKKILGRLGITDTEQES